ncbi:MAG: hypothetical protein ACOYOK_01020 [Pseudobdellovibrionaceae bacterium]
MGFRRKELTGVQCGSRKFLSVDHIQPQFADGNHDQKKLKDLLSQSHYLSIPCSEFEQSRSVGLP